MSIVAMHKKGKGYFQFPLSLLAFREDNKEGLQYIVSFCSCEQARRINPQFPKSDRKASLDEAAAFLGVTIGSHSAMIRRWKEADNFVRQWEGCYGKDALVRIGTTLLWEAHNDTGVSYREFSILCAINSIIGKRCSSPKRITEASIRVRAAGCKSWEVLKSVLPTDKSRNERLLTPHQVRYALEKLHQRKFFARARVGAKTVMYMLGVSDDELRAILRQRETYWQQFKIERVKKDGELMAAIRAVKQAPINVGKDQNVAVPAWTQSQHGNDMIGDIVPDINICSLNKSSENTSRKNRAPLSLESGVVDSFKKEKPKKLNRSEFTDEELAFIDLYHRICLPTNLGFLPVNERSQELDKVLELFAADFDPEEWTENFRQAVEYRREVFRTNPRKYNTLVQVCWKLNY